MPIVSTQGLHRYRHRAKRLVLVRLAHFNRLYGFRWERVSIRDQRSRWGSCSSRGTLSFNWRIATMPPEVADYVIVHELCHLGAMDHSANFWRLVERAIPDFHVHRAALRQIDLNELMGAEARGPRRPERSEDGGVWPHQGPHELCDE